MQIYHQRQTMGEMIERAARAIAISLEVDPESWRDHVDPAEIWRAMIDVALGS